MENNKAKLEAVLRLQDLSAAVEFEVTGLTYYERQEITNRIRKERLDAINKNRKILGLPEVARL